MNSEERALAEMYLKRAGWKKDSCGWWSCPFGYGLYEALDLHKEAAQRTAIAFNDGDPELLKHWLAGEAKSVEGGK